MKSGQTLKRPVLTVAALTLALSGYTSVTSQKIKKPQSTSADVEREIREVDEERNQALRRNDVQALARLSFAKTDGAYDKRKCYAAIRQKQARAVIPPRRGARLWHQDESTGEQAARNKNIQRISEVGRAQWKRESRYYQQSLAETTMLRLKTIFSGRLTARSFEAQACEMMVWCAALNRMTQLGMPDSYAA